jgi:hypothetical protein
MNQTAGTFTPQYRCTAAVRIAVSDLFDTAVTCLFCLSLGPFSACDLHSPGTVKSSGE